MEIYVRPRQSGKTYAKVQWVLEGTRTDSYPGWTRVLLVHSVAEAQRLLREYPALDYRQVFSWGEWQKVGRGASYRTEVAVDNADILLEQMLGQRPARVSLTGEAC